MKELTQKQELFCRYFVSSEFFANGVQSYIRAYSIDTTKQGAYDGAKASANRLLRNEDITKRINELLDDAGLNDSFSDKMLLYWMTQKYNPQAAIQAIKEYNKLQGRIEHRHKVEQNLVQSLEGFDASKLTGEERETLLVLLKKGVLSDQG